MITFCNLEQMPGYLNSSDFDDWVDRFNDLVKSIDGSFYQPITVEFSDERKKKRFGSLSVEEIKRKIRTTWRLGDNAEGILKRIHNYKDFLRNRESLAGAIRDSAPLYLYENVYEKIGDWFDNIAYTKDILGEYVDYEKKIILYTKNIESAGITGRSNKQTFEEVFAHELFHAYHYQNNDIELLSRFDYTSDVVKESLASAFEWYYCSSRGILGTDELMDTWFNNPVWTYPYAGAQRLVQTWGAETWSLDQSKFCEIFQTSKKDMDGALRKLLHINDFYDIKNAVRIRNAKEPESQEPEGTVESKVIHIFKLNQSKFYDDESQNGYAFAADTPRYADMKKIHKGDITVSIFGGKLWAVGVAVSDCYFSSDSHGRGLPGLYVDIDYCVFPNPVDITQFKGNPDYAIRRNEPYVRVFDYPKFVCLILREAKKQNPQLSFFTTMISDLI